MRLPRFFSVKCSNLKMCSELCFWHVLGTDSRLGLGFRLGPNADVQFQLELGPQTNTVPIGGANAVNAVAKKRHVATSIDGSGVKSTDWLNKWRLQMSPGYVPDGDQQNLVMAGERSDNAAATGNNPSDTVAHLRQLYKPQPIPA